MNQINAILGLHAQTSLHAGTGQNTGVIDLPIQREGHTHWPCIFGSAVKGALRTRATEMADKTSVNAVFGPDTSNGNEYAGAIAVSDARLLLMPVRSLTSQFKWVTCPYALSRYQTDAERMQCPVVDLLKVNDKIKDGEAWVPQGSHEKDLFLEEYRFTTQPHDLDSLIAVLAKLMHDPEKATQALQEQLVIVSDNYFAHLASHATPVNAHIAINSDTKIVIGGNLWYEETLPPETLLYVALSAVKARQSSAEMDAKSILGAVTGLFTEHPWLQLGGNETVGMGWCAVSIQKQRS